jgi:type VI secretion system lysozyme-like protein
MHPPAIPRRQRGLRPPLFDRLFDLDPRQADGADARLLAEADLRRSVARNLGHLLDCRSPARDPGHALTVLDWGVPDMTGLPPRDQRAQAAWLAEVRRSLEYFEPRLRDPVVRLHRVDDRGRCSLSISGSMGAHAAAALVVFELALDAVLASA